MFGVRVTARASAFLICIFNLLKAFNLCERNSVVKRVTIIKTRVNEGKVAMVAAVVKSRV